MDQVALIAALNILKGVNAEYRKLLRCRCAEESVACRMATPVEEVNAEMERIRAEMANGSGRHAWSDQGPDDDPDGPRALPPGRG